jgi:hypothetical protein
MKATQFIARRIILGLVNKQNPELAHGTSTKTLVLRPRKLKQTSG